MISANARSSLRCARPGSWIHRNGFCSARISNSCALNFEPASIRLPSSWRDRGRDLFDPGALRCGIVTCGGLCPGLNDVIRSIVFCLHEKYGVATIYGFRFGFEGLVERTALTPIELTVRRVSQIHEVGGTVPGSSRGPQPADEMVDTLERLGIQLLFTIGGDGTLRGAHSIVEEIRRRELKIAVVGVPKTIDNDISFIDMSFGFDTAVEAARQATRAAYVEASCHRSGIGLVKLMGRRLRVHRPTCVSTRVVRSWR